MARRDAVKVFKALREEGAPHAIQAMFTPRAAVSARATRASDRGGLHLHKCRLTTSQKAFAYRAAVVWNRLPPRACAAHTLGAFKIAIRDVTLPV